MSDTPAAARTPTIGKYIDDEERELIESYENADSPTISFLSPERRLEIEAMARATVHGERAKISLRVPKRDLALLKARAAEEGNSYQSLIISWIHQYVTEGSR